MHTFKVIVHVHMDEMVDMIIYMFSFGFSQQKFAKLIDLYLWFHGVSLIFVFVGMKLVDPLITAPLHSFHECWIMFHSRALELRSRNI